MTNGLASLQPEDKKTVKAISSRVGQLKDELSVLEKILKKMISGRPLSEDEKDTIGLLAAVSEDDGKGWVKWDTFKKHLKLNVNV